MSLRRVIGPSEYPVTLEDAKRQCRVICDDEDAMFARLIATANEVVGEDAGLVLAPETWELRVTDPVGAVALPLVPVTALVTINGADASGYMLSIDGDCATVSGDWPEGEVAIRFKAGGDVPQALRHAMLMLISYWFDEERGVVGEDQASKTAYAVEGLVARHRRGWVKA